MHKIIVVDDKNLIRKGIIKMIDFDGNFAELAGEASDGNEAYELIKKVNPDIVITDIRMPECDGISLLNQISVNYPDIQTIVISGYDDFQYVKKAMTYGSINYILKPTDSDELNLSIKKACCVINERREANLDKNGKCVKSFINRINNKLIEPFEEEIFKRFSKTTFCIAIFKSFSGKLENISDLQEINTINGFSDIFVFNDGKRIIVLFCESNVHDLELYEHKIYSTVFEFVQKKTTVGIELISGIGKAVKSIKNLSDSMATALEAISYNIFHTYTGVVLYSGVSNITERNFNISDIEAELLLQITSGNINKVHTILDKIFVEIFDKEISIRTLKKVVMNLCLLLNKLDTGIFDEVSDFIKKINSDDYILTFNSLENIKELIYNLYRYTTKNYFFKSDSQEALMARIKDFIDFNYTQPLSLEGIAETFHINPSYLSNQFKIHTKENINQYINIVRVNSAKKLLKSSDISIQQIAESVGYKDQVYFCKVFKKLTGMTTKEFKISV